MSTEVEVTRLFRIRRTLLEMLKDRKYSVLDEEIQMTRDEFLTKYDRGDENTVKREELVINKHKRPDARGDNDYDDQIFVFFPEEQKVGVNIIKTYAQRMKKEQVYRCILVVQQNLTPFARNAIPEIARAGNFHFEVFLETELLVNVSQHVLVPKHEVLSNADKKTLLQRYTLKETQLPRMQIVDPIAKYYGLKRGQVVKITRNSETAGKYVTYRYVV